jgi:transposase-like protein
MNAPSANLAARRFRAWKTDWHDQVPGAVACLEVDFDKLLPVFAFPETIRKMIRTTNVIERCFREVRRRLKVMGYFQNTPSCQRIIYAQFAKFNAKWERNNQRIKEIKDNYKPAA